MKAMKASELRKLFLDFFKAKAHSIIPSASLIPEHDPTVLFTTAGMHPLVPYLLGQPHPLGRRLANTQKCLRTDDIEEVGDSSHLTFFEMLGSWSLGDYFKKEAIEMSFEFLTDSRYLAIPPEALHITCFAGDSDAPRDEESAQTWQKLGIPREHIHFNPKKDNWWGPAGLTGPCGPDTEMFYDTGKPPHGPDCRPGDFCGKYFEIWNDVFMEYNKGSDGRYTKLAQQNVDTGMGLERTTAVLQGKASVFETELYAPVMSKLRELSKNWNERSARIICDHLRAATFVLGDDRAVAPSNVEHGYVLRRLIRRAIRHARMIGVEGSFCSEIAREFVAINAEQWPELSRNSKFIYSQLEAEEERFDRTLKHGLKEFDRIYARSPSISGKDAFLLFQSYGFPLEMTQELARERGGSVDVAAFNSEYARHQELSRVGAERKFKSGLADHSEMSIKYHTATHLLHSALRKVLGTHVFQKGSNITPERLRFDFTHPEKMTAEQLRAVEDLVNAQIGRFLPVTREMMSVEEAQKAGALALFPEKYKDMGEKVSVYTIGDFSKEVCSGPHVQNTGGLGRFRIVKEEAVSAGVRRIKAVLEPVEDRIDKLYREKFGR